MQHNSFHGERDDLSGGSLEPYQIMPVQAHGRPKLACSHSVRMLMLAVLEDAMRVLLGPAHADPGDRRQTCRWFASDDDSNVFSFARICDVLRFDRRSLRVKLRRQLAAQCVLVERAVA